MLNYVRILFSIGRGRVILIFGMTFWPPGKQKIFLFLGIMFFVFYFILPYSNVYADVILLIATLFSSLALEIPRSLLAGVGAILLMTNTFDPNCPKLLLFLFVIFPPGLFLFWDNIHTGRQAEHSRELRTLRILMNQKSSLYKTVDFSSEAILILDLRGRIIEANNATYKLLQIEKPFGKGVLAAELFNLTPQTFSQPENYVGEFSWLIQPAETLAIKFRIRPLVDRGLPSGFLLILSDISEEKKRFETYLQAAKFSVIGQVSAGLAHELRNPLTTIKGFMQLITPEQWPIHFRPYHQLILDEINFTNQILNNFLLLTNPSAPHLNPLDLEHLTLSAIQILQPTGIMNDVSFKIEFGHTNPRIMGDQEQLLHALLSILQNAVEAAPPKTDILITSYQEKERINLTIEDYGQGIPEALKSRVFDPFFTTRKDGTGLGLTIAQQIIIAHHGELHLTTPLTHQGTKVILCFPALA